MTQSICNPFQKLWSWWKNWAPPSWVETDISGNKWRVTMITPFDKFYERLPDGQDQ